MPVPAMVSISPLPTSYGLSQAASAKSKPASARQRNAVRFVAGFMVLSRMIGDREYIDELQRRALDPGMRVDAFPQTGFAFS